MKVVIVGGGYAGAACATRLAHRARRAGGLVEITVVNPSPWFVERIRLHQLLAGQRLRRRSLARLLARAGVRLVVGRVDAIDRRARTVQLDGRRFEWDRLVIALGSHADVRSTPGATEHAVPLAPDSIPVLAARVAALPTASRVLVVGGGLSGIETATELREARPDLQVGLISRSTLLAGWSQAARDHLRTVLARMGVSAEEGVTVDAVEADRLRTDRGDRPFALCLWTAGFAFPALARAAGLPVNDRGQVLVDPQLRAIGQPAVYAAGDIASPVVDPGQPLPTGCKSAMPTGAQVADNLFHELTGQPLRGLDFALPFYCVSLGRRDGLIQWADADGRPVDRVLTGRRGAWFKEFICRSTWWALAWEARGRQVVLWKRTGRAPDNLPAGGVAEAVT
jgi:NADH dehydrogenase FAD-containing subunit